MANETNFVLQLVTLIAAVLLLIGSFTWFAAPVIKVPTAAEIAAEITIPEAPEVNLTVVEDRLTDIESTLNEEDDWKDEAKALATEEWEDRDYKDLFKAMRDELEIDDRDDIEKVVIKDEDVPSFNVDDKGASVVQELKVYYEDIDGDDKKAYITVETTIEDNEVEEQIFSIED